MNHSHRFVTLCAGLVGLCAPALGSGGFDLSPQEPKPALAQASNPWRFTLKPYFWAAAITGNIDFNNLPNQDADNKTHAVCYRKFFRFGVGPGLALEGFYGIAVVKDEALMQKLMSESSFNMGAGAEASFVFGDFGGSAVAEETFSSELYTDIHTHLGVALELLVSGAWTWPNKELNEAPAEAPAEAPKP